MPLKDYSKHNDQPTAPELCHCGKPLHYPSVLVERTVKKMIQAVGEYVPITVEGRTWKVQRHYIALHGIKAEELPGLGFQEITQ